MCKVIHQAIIEVLYGLEKAQLPNVKI